MCPYCQNEEHSRCLGWITTGRMIPETDRYRERTRMVAEWMPCGCDCRNPDGVPV